MLAIEFVDQFLRKNNKVEECALKLIGIAAIIVAVKSLEDRVLSIEQVLQECEGIYDHVIIQKTERMLLLILDFNAFLPTPIDFLSYFLYLSNPKADFRIAIEKCTNFVYLCFIGKKFKRFISILIQITIFADLGLLQQQQQAFCFTLISRAKSHYMKDKNGKVSFRDFSGIKLRR